MTSNSRGRTLIGGAAVTIVVLAGFTLVHYRNAHARQEQVRTIGADWRQRGLLSQQDYVRLHASQDTVVQTHTLSDKELDWLLATMEHSPSPIVHARVLGILATMANPPASQKERINTAIVPLLQSRNALDSHYALRVQRKLGLSTTTPRPL